MRAHRVEHKKRGGFFRHDKLLMISMISPAVIFVLVVSIFPLVYTFYLSFQNYILTKPNDISFAGLGNYIAMFSDKVVIESIKNTLVITFSSVVLSTLCGVGLAIVVDNITRGKTFFRIALFTPMMLSAVVVGVIWKFLLNNELGIVNYLLKVIGVGHINWMGSGFMATVSIVMTDVWQWSSYTFILVLAALEAMNMEPVEAARVDGANVWQIFRHIKFPAILPALEVAIVFRLIWAFRNFDLAYALTKGGPGTSTETMALEVWRQAFSRYNVGVSSAIATVMFLILMLISLVLMRRTIKQSKKEDAS